MSFTEGLTKFRYPSNDQRLTDLWTSFLSDKHLNVKPVARSVVLTTALTMQRPTDVCRMTTDQIDQRNSTWAIPVDSGRRIVPLTDAAMDIINMCIQENANSYGIVFPAPLDGSRSIDASAVSRMFRKTRKNFGWDDQGIADIPVVAAFVLAGKGIDVSIISKIRGLRNSKIQIEELSLSSTYFDLQREALLNLQDFLLQTGKIKDVSLVNLRRTTVQTGRQGRSWRVAGKKVASQP